MHADFKLKYVVKVFSTKDSMKRLMFTDGSIDLIALCKPLSFLHAAKF